MLTPENTAMDGLESTDLAERIRSATQFLELIAANRGLLAEVSADDRALDTVFDHVWQHREYPLGPPQFMQVSAASHPIGS